MGLSLWATSVQQSPFAFDAFFCASQRVLLSGRAMVRPFASSNDAKLNFGC
jgi:hypothetical protein